MSNNHTAASVPPTDPRSPCFQPAFDWIERHAFRSPEALALLDVAGSRSFTFAQANDRVGRVAASLAALGVRQGDRVGFLLHNSTDIIEIMFGCWRIGAICLALNWRLTAPELAFILEDSAPAAIYFDSDLRKIANELAATTSVAHWIETDGIGGDTPFERALAAAEPLLAKQVRQPLSDMCLLMYSSGTTGKPKGVIITHQMLFYAAINTGIHARITSGSVNLTTMPLFHIGAINACAFPVLFFGGTNIIQRTFDPGETLRLIGDPALKVSHFLGVPAIFAALQEHPDVETTDFSRLGFAITGAESVPEALLRYWFDKGIPIQEGYGMTETAAGISCLGPADVPGKIGSAGQPLMHVDVKAMQIDGSEAAPGKPGELWIRGPSVTPGYWNRPDATDGSFDGPWLKSGDIGRVDAEGYVYIEDRLKDMYISGGENVYPAEVESVIYDMPGVREVAVIGVPDAKWGEVGCAVIAARDGMDITLAGLSLHCTGKLARYKIPHHIVALDELPRNASGKVLKTELRKIVPSMLAPTAC